MSATEEPSHAFLIQQIKAQSRIFWLKDCFGNFWKSKKWNNVYLIEKYLKNHIVVIKEYNNIFK